MQNRSVSLLKKQIQIRQELKNFPAFGSTSKQKVQIASHNQNKQKAQSLQASKKFGVKKGKSLQISFNNYSSVNISKMKLNKNVSNKQQGCLLKRKRKNRRVTQQQFSKISIVSSGVRQSIPSTTALSYESEVLRISEENKKLKQIILKQKLHIQNLQKIVSNM